jgi:hypothetical protein
MRLSKRSAWSIVGAIRTYILSSALLDPHCFLGGLPSASLPKNQIDRLKLASIMDRIDNPLDVAIRQLQENSESTPLVIALKLSTAIPGLAIADSIWEHFSTNKRIERVNEVLIAFKRELEALQNSYNEDKQRLDAISENLKSAEFNEAVIAAAEEAVRNTNAEKIKRLARVLANGSDPNTEPSSEDDLTSFIRDVSMLSESDIQVFKQLASSVPLGLMLAHGSQEKSPFQHFIDDAARGKLMTDDFYSHCFRLVGFGLAVQIPSNSPSQAANKYLFMLTRRGHRLAALLADHT